jgi:hypothetical protein
MLKVAISFRSLVMVVEQIQAEADVMVAASRTRDLNASRRVLSPLDFFPPRIHPSPGFPGSFLLGFSGSFSSYLINVSCVRAPTTRVQFLGICQLCRMQPILYT